jgi:hypothetical protein
MDASGTIIFLMASDLLDLPSRSSSRSPSRFRLAYPSLISDTPEERISDIDDN